MRAVDDPGGSGRVCLSKNGGNLYAESSWSRRCFFLAAPLFARAGRGSSASPKPKRRLRKYRQCNTHSTPEMNRGQHTVIRAQDSKQANAAGADALRQVPGCRSPRRGRRVNSRRSSRAGWERSNPGLARCIPINQGLAGLLTSGSHHRQHRPDRIVRGPQSTLYGPRALAGVVQIFTKNEAVSHGAFSARPVVSTVPEISPTREPSRSLTIDGLSRIDTDNAAR